MLELTSSLERKILLSGRSLLYFAAFCIPLAFCRETMYIFQIKTMLMQYIGLSLAILVCIHQCTAKQAPRVIDTWASRFIILFLLWQVFKCWDSIAPVISWRQMTRIVWLPVFALSVPYFFRERNQLERLITVIISSALIVYLIAWFFHLSEVRRYFDNLKPSTKGSYDFANFPILGEFFKNLFYPGQFESFLEIKKEFKPNEPIKVFPLTPHSFNPGKHDAATFGNKNFVTAYINLTSILMIYKAIVLLYAKKLYAWLRFPIVALLFYAVAFSYFHFIRLENRGSWIGWAFGFLALIIYSIWQMKRNGVSSWILKTISISLISLLSLGVGFIYLKSPDRFLSIFTISSLSNELRLHIWQAYYEAWASDREFSGFESDAWRMSTGMGTYSFRVVYPKYRSKRIFQIEQNAHNTETSHPHNEYLGYLGELGIVGLLLYLAMAVALLIFLLRLPRRGDTEQILLIGALLFALFSIWFHQLVGVMIRYTGVASQFWLTIGIVLAVGNFYRKPDALPKTSKAKGIGFSVAVMATILLIMPDITWPLKWMQSQHFYQMGHVQYGNIRSFRENLDIQTNNYKKYQKEYKAFVQKVETFQKNLDQKRLALQKMNAEHQKMAVQLNTFKQHLEKQKKNTQEYRANLERFRLQANAYNKRVQIQNLNAQQYNVDYRKLQELNQNRERGKKDIAEFKKTLDKMKKLSRKSFE